MSGVTTDTSNAPKPWRRPVIDLTRHGKTWGNRPASSLVLEDVVSPGGIVQDIYRGADAWTIQYTNGDSVSLLPDQEVYSFSAGE
jgi:hypothetical protein